MRSTIIPVVNSVREEYWVKLYDQAVVSGQAAYTIPQRSAGAILRDVVFVDPSGNEIDLQRLAPEHIKATFPFGYQLPLYTFGYYLQNDQFMPYPQQAQNATQYTLRMKALRRPNNLTLSTNCGQVTGINGLVVSLSYIDPSWTSSTLFDVIQNFPQFTSISDGQTITNVGASSLTFSTIPAGLAVGMWVCPTLMSCIPQLPYECFPLLVQRGIIRVAESLGDQTGSQIAEKRYEEMRKDFTNLIEPRVQGGTKKIVNRNSPYGWGNVGAPFLR